MASQPPHDFGEKGKATPIEPGVIARFLGAAKGATSGAVSGLIRGANEAWFGPAQPLTPVAPATPEAETKGRSWDYPYGWNYNPTPRSEAGTNGQAPGIDFPSLRAITEPTQGGLDILRGCIETVKDRMAGEPWQIKPRKGKETAATAKRAEEITEILQQPDGEHDYLTWQRMLLEDLLVLDAPAIYLQPGPKGYKIPEVVDGATIKVLLRGDGRRPDPPDPAYQQNLRGLPAVNYSSDELIYAPRNVRASHVYGFGPTEQAVVTASIALRRQAYQLSYYTEGNDPNIVMSCPKEWTVDQIAKYQAYWDSLLTGNLAERRRIRFTPEGCTPHELKPGVLKDEFDEWLARLFCWFLNIPCSALIKQVNRASGQTMKESAQQEGLEPLKLYWKSLKRRVLVGCFADGTDYEHAWTDEEVVDPLVKAQVLQIACGKPWMTQTEAREKSGLPAATPEQEEELNPPPPPALMPPGGKPGEQLKLPGTDTSGANGAKPKPDAKGAAEKVAKSAGRLLQPRPAGNCHCAPQGAHRYP
jgi:hypothetical protein